MSKVLGVGLSQAIFRDLNTVSSVNSSRWYDENI